MKDQIIEIFYLPVPGNQAKVHKELRPDLHKEGRKLSLVVVYT